MGNNTIKFSKDGYGECEIFIDENKSIHLTTTEGTYLLGKIHFDNGICHFIPTKNIAFIEEALIAIAQFISKASAMPSDKEIDGLFNDKPKDI